MIDPLPAASPGRSPSERQLAVSVVVPVHNGAAALPELVARLRAVLAARGPDAEIVLVNDGSRDASWQAIAELAAGPGPPRVRGIDLRRNYGQHNALLCGIRAAAGAVVVTMDDDLQHPPEEIPKLLAALGEEVDVVYGTPLAESHGLLRVAASRATKLVLEGAMGAAIARRVSAFRAFRTELRHAFEQYGNPYVSIDVLLTWATTRFAAVPVRHEPRRSGRSVAAAGASRAQHGHRLQRRTPQAGEPRRLRLDPAGDRRPRLRGRPLPRRGHQRSRLPIPRLGDRDLFGRPAVHPRHPRRVPGPHAP